MTDDLGGLRRRGLAGRFGAHGVFSGEFDDGGAGGAAGTALLVGPALRGTAGGGVTTPGGRRAWTTPWAARPKRTAPGRAAASAGSSAATARARHAPSRPVVLEA